MTIEVEATYENGTLKPDRPLALRERQRVRITVHTRLRRVEQSYGLLGWTGGPKLIEQVALDPEFGVGRSPGSAPA